MNDLIHTNRATITDTVNAWHSKGERIVFTNGVFDLIHPGHVVYLEQAAALGTKLIVGLNSDRSVKTLNKGECRPYNDQQSRAMVLSGLRSVALVVIFDESTPLELILHIKPHVLVKGGDYTIDRIVGAQEVIAYGGEVKQLDFLPGYSTTALEQKIKQGG